MFEYITAQEAANKWDITVRRVQVLCTQGRIPGAKRHGWSWAIPMDAIKPVDARTSRRAKRNTQEDGKIKMKNTKDDN